MKRKPPVILRLQQWFTENPDECLYVSDVMTKFECGLNAARASLYGLEASGFLRRYSGPCGEKGGAPRFVYELAQKEIA